MKQPPKSTGVHTTLTSLGGCEGEGKDAQKGVASRRCHSDPPRAPRGGGSRAEEPAWAEGRRVSGLPSAPRLGGCGEPRPYRVVPPPRAHRNCAHTRGPPANGTPRNSPGVSTATAGAPRLLCAARSTRSVLIGCGAGCVSQSARALASLSERIGRRPARCVSVIPARGGARPLLVGFESPELLG